jgi:hypothetical protein
LAKSLDAGGFTASRGSTEAPDDGNVLRLLRLRWKAKRKEHSA